MSTKTVNLALNDLLRDLAKMQYELFFNAILDRQKEPKVRRSDVEDRSRVHFAHVLISTFTESGVVEVVLEALGEIGCNAQKEKFDYGDIMKVETSGASMLTAQQDNLDFEGKEASYAMAEIDLVEMNNYKSTIKNVARQKGVDAALIAAIISRSCRAGKWLTGGWGGYDEKRQKYNTFGLMQIDVSPNGGGHTPKGSWDSEEHLCQATDILIYFIMRVKHKFRGWSKEQQLKGGIAAYNAGDGNIGPDGDVDSKTSNGDYANDVVARAQWYKSNGGF
uniref:Lysozyme g n=1 Tax=Seriola lalandi dorsalis TaxID=1841481 RepID=A0A3B4WIT6_SERLL